MKIDTFLSLLKKRQSNPLKTTGTFKIRVINYANEYFKIIDGEGVGVKVKFNTLPEHLTIFEAGLLYCTCKGIKPYDYAQYHKCEAGKRFIESIESITFLKSKVTIEYEEGETIR